MRDERKLPNDDYADSNSPSASLSALPTASTSALTPPPCAICGLPPPRAGQAFTQ